MFKRLTAPLTQKLKNFLQEICMKSACICMIIAKICMAKFTPARQKMMCGARETSRQHHKTTRNSQTRHVRISESVVQIHANNEYWHKQFFDFHKISILGGAGETRE